MSLDTWKMIDGVGLVLSLVIVFLVIINITYTGLKQDWKWTQLIKHFIVVTICWGVVMIPVLVISGHQISTIINRNLDNTQLAITKNQQEMTKLSIKLQTTHNKQHQKVLLKQYQNHRRMRDQLLKKLKKWDTQQSNL